MQQISFSMERDGYDSDIVDGLLEDIANVAHQRVVPADLRPTPPPNYRGDGGATGQARLTRSWLSYR